MRKVSEAAARPDEAASHGDDPATHRRTEEITRWLADWSLGDAEALDRLVPAIYGELTQLASTYLRRERSPTLETSELVHEAFLRLIDQKVVDWRSRSHFFGIAARLMRRILVDRARARSAEKRGGRSLHLVLDQVPVSIELNAGLVALDDALKDLEAVSPRQAQVVELRYFAGLTREEIAEILEVSVPTVTRRWRVARAWLFRYLSPAEDDRV